MCTVFMVTCLLSKLVLLLLSIITLLSVHPKLKNDLLKVCSLVYVNVKKFVLKSDM